MRFMEEDRRSFSDIAASYDAWAVAAETEAEEILASMDACAIEVQSDRRCRATNLMAEALELIRPLYGDHNWSETRLV